MNDEISDRIEYSKLENGVIISTVKLNYADPGMFETCVFYPSGVSSVVGRYTSYKAAVKGHQKIVIHERSHEDAKNKFEQSMTSK